MYTRHETRRAQAPRWIALEASSASLAVSLAQPRTCVRAEICDLACPQRARRRRRRRVDVDVVIGRQLAQVCAASARRTRGEGRAQTRHRCPRRQAPLSPLAKGRLALSDLVLLHITRSTLLHWAWRHLW
eukprot:scaffold8068_cov565-Prasinococcus_capsulatus_cf.AAC.4